MLERCHRDQWKVGDLDWSKKPRPMSREDEMAIVQLFTDMAGIERLAGELFREQERRANDPVLKEIFRTFVKDEVRHAHAAQMLADHYDVHHYKSYSINENLQKFTPHFLEAIKHLSDEVANAYVTGGELILDIALLRSINDYVADDMSAQAMHLINRDESRHIAIDYYMAEYYASDAFLTAAAEKKPKDRLHAWWTFANVIFYAQPFFKAVFFRPMELVDPSGKRLKEAFKRFQLLGMKPGATMRPFAKFMRALQDLFNHPVTGSLFGNALARVAGVEPALMKRLYDESELARARSMSYEALAEEALAIKGAEG
jgi:hypothetical protein